MSAARSSEKPGLLGVVDTVNRYFSDTFAKLGNVGQVELHEAKDANNKDDFKNYGINIKVKFRAKQDLQLLNSNVQSGGEKSLSIMLFILALQDMIKVPFRVVDEINQGMDKHYERAIFERIVEVLSLLALLVQKYKY
jgi:chromosome segregation ATPase